MKSKKNRSCTKHVDDEHSKHEEDSILSQSNANSSKIFDFKVTDLFLVAFVMFLLLQGKFGIPTLRVLIDDSMEPELPFGCIALMQPILRKDISNGDIIMLEEKSSFVRICHVAKTDPNGLFCVSRQTEELLWLSFTDQTSVMSKNFGYIPWIGLAHVFAFKMKRPLLIVAVNMFFHHNIFLRTVVTASLWFITMEVPSILQTIGASSIVLFWIAGDTRYGTTLTGRLQTLTVLVLIFSGSLLASDSDAQDVVGTLLALLLIVMETIDMTSFFVIVKWVCLRVLDEAEKATLLVTDPQTSFHIERAWNELLLIFAPAAAKPKKLQKVRICVCCGKAASKKCGGCHSVFYCSPECQRSDWSSHRGVCTPKQACT